MSLLSFFKLKRCAINRSKIEKNNHSSFLLPNRAKSSIFFMVLILNTFEFLKGQRIWVLKNSCTMAVSNLLLDINVIELRKLEKMLISVFNHRIHLKLFWGDGRVEFSLLQQYFLSYFYENPVCARGQNMRNHSLYSCDWPEGNVGLALSDGWTS